MIIHQTREQLGQLVQAIDRLPMVGQSLQDVVSAEYYRQKTKAAMEANMVPPTIAVDSNPYGPRSTISDTPTTLIDDGWGLRLGLIRG
jgi:hypothetical protein